MAGLPSMRDSTMRVSHEPAYVLHRHDWSETSLILEVFTRSHGRMVLAAKGAKRPSSNFRPVLLPLQPLRLSWSGSGEVRTLKGAEWGGGQVMPAGDALLSGYYANELLLRLLAREDAHPLLFDAYAALVHLLASADGDALHAAGLRAFELLLLREAGHLPALDRQTVTLAALQDGVDYRLVTEAGLRAVHADDRLGLSGTCWLGLAGALQQQAPLAAIVQLLADWPAAERSQLRRQLRELLDYHCGSTPLRTRQLLHELRQL